MLNPDISGVQLSMVGCSVFSLANIIRIHLGTERKLVPQNFQNIIWKCKRKYLDFTIDGDIVARTEPRRGGARNCMQPMYV